MPPKKSDLNNACSRDARRKRIKRALARNQNATESHRAAESSMRQSSEHLWLQREWSRAAREQNLCPIEFLHSLDIPEMSPLLSLQIGSSARDIISRVYDFMKKEATNNYAEKLTDARWRTARAVGVSESTVTRILRERRAQAIKFEDTPFNQIYVECKSERSETASDSGEASTNAPVSSSVIIKEEVDIKEEPDPENV